MASTPWVFVSATSRDLGSYRQAVKDVLLTREWHPIVQDNFAPDYRAVHDLLRAKISKCDAVICLIGRRYGEEPKNRGPGEPRRSYTQMEYEIAKELGKPIYRFISTDDCVVDDANSPPEDSERAALQQAYKSQIESSDLRWHPFDSREGLLEQVRDIQLPRHPFRHWRLLIGTAMAVVLAVAGYFGQKWAFYRDPDPCSESNLTLLVVSENKLLGFVPEKPFEESAKSPQEPPSPDLNTCQARITNETGRPIRIWRYFPEPNDLSQENQEATNSSDVGIDSTRRNAASHSDSRQYRLWRPTWVCGASTENLPFIGGWSFIYVEDLLWSLDSARNGSSLDEAWFTPTKMGWVYLAYGKQSKIIIQRGFFEDNSHYIVTTSP